jgi:carboxyl-terminal processing protease
VVLDLRDNPGGVLDEAVAVCDLFLDEGPIVSTRGRGEAEERHEATPGGVDPSLRLVVLVNGLSASASEIVAGALQVTGRATLVGTRTYGKGSVQVLFEHRDGSALKLTTSRYYLPNGEPVAAAVGRVPDVVVRLSDAPSPADALRSGLAEQLPEGPDRDALLALVDAMDDGEAPPEPDVPWELPPAERLAADVQLARAVAVVRGE